MLTKEKTAAIRKELKEHGLTSKDVSVRGQLAGLEECINVKIRNPKIDIEEVSQLVAPWKKVRRDIANDEILGGGNTFVFVDYEGGIFNEVVKPYIPEAEALINEAVSREDNAGVPLNKKDGGFIFVDQISYRGKRRLIDSSYIEGIARYLFFIDSFNRI